MNHIYLSYLDLIFLTLIFSSLAVILQLKQTQTVAFFLAIFHEIPLGNHQPNHVFPLAFRH